MPTHVDTIWELVRGEPAELVIRFRTDAEGTPLDLTDRSYRCHLRPYAASTLHTAATVTAPEPETGEIVLHVSAVQTAGIPWNLGLWSLEETIEDVARTILEGDVTVGTDVTR